MHTNHLGTPRTIFDQTGSLANMKRHDYLPFGEELFEPAGGRSAAMGCAQASEQTASKRSKCTASDHQGIKSTGRESVRMNQRMRTSLAETNPADFVESEKLSETLSGLLLEGFTQLDGAVVFTAMRDNAERVKPENFPDLTGFECFVNHIHVEDQLEGPVPDPLALLKQGIAFALGTERGLRATFPGKPFKVIVAATARRCDVRFHLARPGEEWLARNLDGYGAEAILVLET